jgi:HK97 family phage prohead protease
MENLEFRLLPKSEDKQPLFRKTKGGTLKGYAIVWDVPYLMNGFFERVSREAIQGADLSQIVCLLNHDPSLVLGRTTSNTLKVGSDSRGLWFEAKIPDTPTGAEVATLVERGDLHQCSFSFRMATNGDTWENDPSGLPIRTIDSFHSIVDVSVVTYPASPTTSVYMARTSPDEHHNTANVEYFEVDPDDEFERIYQAQAQMMKRDTAQLKALTAGSTTTTTWTPTVSLTDADFARMESIMKWDAEVELLKMKADRATNAHIDIILARMEAVMDADTVRMANQNKQFTTKRF